MTDQEPVVKLTFDDRENAGRIACVTFNNPE